MELKQQNCATLVEHWSCYSGTIGNLQCILRLLPLRSHYLAHLAGITRDVFELRYVAILSEMMKIAVSLCREQTKDNCPANYMPPLPVITSKSLQAIYGSVLYAALDRKLRLRPITVCINWMCP